MKIAHVESRKWSTFRQVPKVWIYFLKYKYEVFEAFRSWKVIIENETDLKIKRAQN